MPSDRTSATSRSDGRILVAANLGTVAAILPAFLVGGVAVQARADLGFGAGAQGALLALPFLVAAVCSAAVGRGVEQLGAARSLRVSSVSSAVVLLALSRAPSTATLALGLGVAGGVNALAQPAANLLVAQGVAPERHGLAFGLKQAAMPTATLLAGLAVPTVAVTAGWRWALTVAVAVPMAALVALPTVPRRGPDAARPTAPGPRPRPDVPLLPLVVLACGAGLGAASAGALAGFLVSGAVDAGMAAGAAGFLLAFGSCCGIAMRIVVGARADRRAGGHLRVVATMLGAGAAAFVLYAGAAPAGMVAVTPIAFGLGWAWPGLFNFAVVRRNPSAPAAATGITQTGTYLGAMAGPLAFGWMVERWSYGTAWLAASSWFVAAACAVLVGRRLLRPVPFAQWRSPSASPP